MVKGTLRALFSIEGLLVVVVVLGGIGGVGYYTGAVDIGDIPGIDDTEWTSDERLEETPPVIQMEDRRYTDLEVNNEINQLRHERGLNTLTLTRSTNAGARYFDLPANTTSGDVLRSVHTGCVGEGAVVVSVSHYDPRYRDNNVEIAASMSRVVDDAVDGATRTEEARSVVFGEQWSEHGVGVRVGDQGRVVVVQAFC